MKRLGSAVVFVSLLLIGSTAAADSLRATRGQPVEEVEHAVSVSVVEGVATYRVRRTFVNRGRWVEEATVTVMLPPGAAANGLRIEAGGTWIDAELVGAGRASRMYDQLTGIGQAPMQDPVLMKWESSSMLTLQIFPLRSGVPATLEYTLTAPVTYADGRWTLGYPRATARSALLAPTVRVTGEAPRIDGDAVASAQLATLVKGAPIAPISVAAPPPSGPAVTRYGVVPTGTGKSVARLEVDVAPALSMAPPDLRVVFVLDASQSVDVDGIAAEMELIDAWTRRAPGAQVEVVVFRRDAEALFGELVPGEQAVGRLREALAAGRLAPGNGSNLDRGLALAVQRLSGASGSRRIIALTDATMRRGFNASSALSGLSDEAIVHIAMRGGQLSSRRSRLDRDDTHRLAPLALAHHGVAVKVEGAVDASNPAFVDAVEYLVRPTRLDAVTLDLGRATSSLDVPTTLDEGAGFTATVHLTGAPRRAGALHGLLWTEPWERHVAVDDAYSRLTAATVFSEDRDDGLTRPEQLAIARFAHIVSPVTSFLAIEPGTRPSTEGIVRRSLMSGGYGMMGGRYGISSRCGGFGVMRRDDLRPTLTSTLRSCFADGPPVQPKARLHVETTGDEIVGVRLTGESDVSLGACVTEAVWRTTLPASMKGSVQDFNLALLEVAPTPE